MQPEEVEKFLDKVMPKEGDTNENGTPSALALSRSGIPQVLTKPKKVDPTKELIWPDGHAPNLTLQQQEKIAEYLKRVRENSPDSKAKINSWPRVPHAYVVHILNMMIEAKFSDISYSGIPNKLMQQLSTGEVK